MLLFIVSGKLNFCSINYFYISLIAVVAVHKCCKFTAPYKVYGTGGAITVFCQNTLCLCQIYGKEVIAVGQTYFAVKTRQQELIDNYEQLSEDQKRLAIRNEMITHNKSLAEAAQMAGIEDSRDYAIFQNKGYQGLYGGLGAKEIHARKGLKKSQRILDHMGSTELAANLFRATQTDEKLRRENIQGKQAAYDTHYEVGKKVRQTIKELGGTMPEDLPTPQKSIAQIEREQEKRKLKSSSDS